MAAKLVFPTINIYVRYILWFTGLATADGSSQQLMNQPSVEEIILRIYIIARNIISHYSTYVPIIYIKQQI